MVAGRPSKGRIWRHDPPGMRSMYGGSLVSCAGSLVIVDLPLPAQRLEFSALRFNLDWYASVRHWSRGRTRDVCSSRSFA